LGFYWDSIGILLGFPWEFSWDFPEVFMVFHGVFVVFSWAGLEFDQENSWYFPYMGAGHRLVTDEIMELIVVRRCWN
jgi:hypothetical protein